MREGARRREGERRSEGGRSREGERRSEGGRRRREGERHEGEREEGGRRRREEEEEGRKEGDRVLHTCAVCMGHANHGQCCHIFSQYHLSLSVHSISDTRDVHVQSTVSLTQGVYM